MFRLIVPPSGQTQNILLVHSVSAHCTTSTMFCTVFFIWPDDGRMSWNMSPNF